MIARCYWPLLNMASKHKVPIGIEASGYTLERINILCPDWIVNLKELIKKKLVSFVGCGYAQIIGPIVPYEVNKKNLEIGNQVYDKILGNHPQIALINEQAYSSGLVPLYLEEGFRAIIMEWDNPFRANPEWLPEWRYHHQLAKGANNRSIPVIWNKSVSFQKLQRYAHGESTLTEYLSYLRGHIGEKPRFFPIYGNDVECFDFRPGRFMTEADLQKEGEWNRIDDLLYQLASEKEIKWVSLEQVLEERRSNNCGLELHLSSSQFPIPVKKQEKYNVMRWALTGRDDLGINTRCWKIYDSIKSVENNHYHLWKDLCFLWSSDFRTHITEKRWKKYLEKLRVVESELGLDQFKTKSQTQFTKSETHFDCEHTKKTEGRSVELKAGGLELSLDCKKGLSLSYFTDTAVHPEPLLRTIPHGYFDDITWANDYYCGHLVVETPGKPKITDLVKVTPTLTEENDFIMADGIISSQELNCQKSWRFDVRERSVELQLKGSVTKFLVGSARIGFLNLNPDVFDSKTLYFATHNGGPNMEYFPVNSSPINHGEAVSFLVSAQQGLGVTGNIVEIGDNKKALTITVDKSKCCVMGMVRFVKVRDKFLFRLCFSLQEVDDTSKPKDQLDFEFSMKIQAKDKRASGVLQ